MRVSIDCRYIRERPSGIGAYTRALLDRVPALAPNDHFHLWADPRAPQPLCDAPNVAQTVVRAPANGLRTLLSPARLVDLSGVDVLHAPFNTLGRGLRCACVVTVHDVMWVVRPDLCGGISPVTPLRAAYYRLGIMGALRQAARLIAISQATADSIALIAPEASSRVRVIPHGVEARFQPPEDREVVRAHLRQHLRLARPYLLVIGQNAPYKNHVAVLRAFAAARFDQPVELLMLQRLYARGSRLTFGVDRLDHRAQDLGVADRVRFICGLRDDEVLKLFLKHPSSPDSLPLELPSANLLAISPSGEILTTQPR